MKWASYTMSTPDKAAVLARLDLHAFYSEAIQSLRTNGKDEAVGLCPFHDDQKPSFSVNLSKGVWNCFACSAGGDVFSFVERRDGVSFTQAVNPGLADRQLSGCTG